MVIKKNVNILHECKESRDVDRLLRGSMIGEFIDDENKNSIKNPLLYRKKNYKIQLHIYKNYNSSKNSIEK
jgi:hypothetical protein